MENIELSFKDWVLKFIDVDLPIGDLAKDISNDEAFPAKSKNRNQIIEYLESKGASYLVVDVANECLDFYEATHLIPLDK